MIGYRLEQEALNYRQRRHSDVTCPDGSVIDDNRRTLLCASAAINDCCLKFSVSYIFKNKIMPRVY